MTPQDADATTKISATKQKKIDAVKTLGDKVQKAKVIILADYQGLKHKQLETLRKLLKKSDGEFIVAKNRLIKRSLGDYAASMQDNLKEETAVLFAYSDEVAPIKELLKFFKTAGIGKPKAGLLGATILTENEIQKLAALPTREILLSMLLRQLNAPIQGLHSALKWNINTLVWAIKGIQEKKIN